MCKLGGLRSETDDHRQPQVANMICCGIFRRASITSPSRESWHASYATEGASTVRTSTETEDMHAPSNAALDGSESY